ncbi:MAG: transglutaminase family protein [Planctomycetota bacterium]|nr:transglutaminase family protein [Planctomycetota bacterium]
MSRKKRELRTLKHVQEPVKTGGRKTLLNHLLTFTFGAVIATTVTILVTPKESGSSRHHVAGSGIRYSKPPPGRIIDPSLIDPGTNIVRKWRKVASLNELLKLSHEELEKVDIAEMNLLCATDLPGAENISISKILMSLDAFAASVRYQTNRHLYRVNDPKYAEHYKHSENVLRAEFLVQVLQEDCGVHYNLQRVRDLDFTNSKDLFIHGLIGSNGGTCSSMPVLYVAVARRLGYPMSLALAPGHVLARWDAPKGSGDPMKHFNVEGSGYGFSPYDDEHYRKWPRKMTKEEAASGFYLRPLTGAEMLAVFLTTRGHCLLDTGQFEQAKQAYASAQRFSAKDPYLARFIHQADSRIKARQYAKAMKGATTRPVVIRRTRYRLRDPMEELRRIEAINDYNRRLMERHMRPPTPASPYGLHAPQPGVPNPYQPYRPPMPGQPPRP